MCIHTEEMITFNTMIPKYTNTKFKVAIIEATINKLISCPELACCYTVYL